MKAMIVEQFEILRRILDRMKDYAEMRHLSGVIDYTQHMHNELEILKQAIEEWMDE